MAGARSHQKDHHVGRETNTMSHTWVDARAAVVGPELGSGRRPCAWDVRGSDADGRGARSGTGCAVLGPRRDWMAMDRAEGEARRERAGLQRARKGPFGS